MNHSFTSYNLHVNKLTQYIKNKQFSINDHHQKHQTRSYAFTVEKQDMLQHPTDAISNSPHKINKSSMTAPNRVTTIINSDHFFLICITRTLLLHTYHTLFFTRPFKCVESLISLVVNNPQSRIYYNP